MSKYISTFNGSGEYLAHFNKNHSSKNGQFTSGDGDGDGIVNDHNYRVSQKSRKDAISNTTNYMISSNNTKRNKILDKYYDPKNKKAQDFKKNIDDAFNKAAKEYKKSKDINKVAKIIDNALKDSPYDFSITDTKYTDNGEKYIHFLFETYSKKNTYSISGTIENNKKLQRGTDWSSFRGYKHTLRNVKDYS